jgi:hypothetical protein
MAPSPALRCRGTRFTPAETFRTSGGQKRDFLALVDATTGQATTWSPEPANLVNVVVATPNLFVAGGFCSVANAVERTQFAEVDAVTGQPTSFFAEPDWQCGGDGDRWRHRFLVAGFNAVNGVSRNHGAAINLSTHQLTTFNPSANADTLDFEVADLDGKNLYVGGSWNFLQSSSGKAFGNRNLATFSKSKRHVQSGFKPNPDLPVHGITVAPGGTIYVGG